MRQQVQSARDECFRICLQNMRFASCTQDDINFLKTLIVNPKAAGQDYFNRAKFRSAAVITSLNSQKDRINELGLQKFAKDNSAELHHFYSTDSVIPPGNNSMGKKKKYVNAKIMGPKFQEKLWGLPPSASKERVAAKLSLCKGMPVMICNNDATELCITRGQDGTVWGWDAASLPDGKETLKTLFIKLNKPPRNVQFPGLPMNVVPIPTANHGPLSMRMPSGDFVSLKRWQVPALPFFAMTDYASQGKTRITNIVDLGRSRNHQAVYTALSRSASVDGTAILQSFDASKITRGISGYLRQEFRELEILNKMTELRYEGSIDENSISELRNPTLMNYYRLKQTNADLSISWHQALELNTVETEINPDTTGVLWNIAENKKAHEEHAKKLEKEKAEKQKKRMANQELAAAHQHTQKKVKIQQISSSKPKNKSGRMTTQPIIGPKWDSVNWSCAYDSLLFILYNTWCEKQTTVPNEWMGISPYMKMVVGDFSKSRDINLTRNKLRKKFYEDNTVNFPLGNKATDIQSVVEHLLGIVLNDDNNITTAECEKCSHTSNLAFFNLSNFILLSRPRTGYPRSIQGQIEIRIRKNCLCDGCKLRGRKSFLNHPDFSGTPPPFIFFPLQYNIETNSRLIITPGHIEYELKGIIYLQSNHFTARFIDKARSTWFHDGIAGMQGVPDSFSGSLDEFLRFKAGNTPAIAFYARS
ncbi:hypothetical protein GALMADRAFT_73952 [Galerina marginata CBS 339.88]|uniref:Uncharacterized protein n=1 Tax=Galerina marginata (strain CBS 339.88) TaxID=685588 RepID=A0A067SN84_GALM3|nr:hypothetical protein GALMADRAFT_73952 [Galerina marginata CBS 339.88]